MKVTMLAIGVFTNLGALAALQISPDLARYSEYVVAFVCGSVGFGIHAVCFGTSTPREMIAKALASSGVAMSFGPVTCMLMNRFAGIETTVEVLVPVSTIWGIGGLQLIKAYGPKLLDSIGALGIKKFNDLAGTSPIANDSPKEPK